MLLIHFYNMSHFKMNNNFYSEIRGLLYGETTLYVFDTLNMIFYIWVLFSAFQFHFNLNLVSGVQYICHLIDNIAILIMRFNWILGDEDGDINPVSDPIFFWCMTTSVCCLVTAMCSLPFFILERCFATILIKDYETKPRRYISCVLVFFLLVIGIAGGWVLQDKSNTLFVVFGLIAVNGIALSLNVFLLKWNMKKYEECQNVIHSRVAENGQYSLARRFQISENLKSLHMLKIIVLYIGLMNVVLVISVLFSSFDLSPERQAFCTLVLNGSVFIYSVMLPQITTYYCSKWQTQTSVFKSKLVCFKARQMRSVGPSMDGLGRGGTGPNDAMDRYFDQLKESWERD